MPPLRQIVELVYQTIDGKDVYRSVPEKADNLLYFLIKAHPFIDGCNLIGAAIFLYYLQQNDSMRKDNYCSEKDFAAVTSMVLLIAHSLPVKKELITRLIVQFILR